MSLTHCHLLFVMLLQLEPEGSLRVQMLTNAVPLGFPIVAFPMSLYVIAGFPITILLISTARDQCSVKDHTHLVLFN